MTKNQESAADGRKRTRIPYRRKRTQDLNPQSIFRDRRAEIAARADAQRRRVRRVSYFQRVSRVMRRISRSARVSDPAETRDRRSSLLATDLQSSNSKAEIGTSTSDDRHHANDASTANASNPRASNLGQGSGAGALLDSSARQTTEYFKL
jgi:hypothetical protein